MGRQDYETETLIAHALRGEGFDASEDGTGRGTPLVPVAFDTTQVTSKANRSNPQPGDPCHPLAAGAHAPAVAFGIRSDATREGSAKTPSADADGRVRLRDPGMGIYAELAPTVDASQPHAVAFDLRGREGGAMPEGEHHTANIRASSGGSSRSYIAASAVRRLTPRECERLQGFPDDYTLIPYRGKPAADGPRYKALGNSMAVPVMRWIGERIAAVEAIAPLAEAAE
jgi:DNA (cytosine-5)-methyltransferase 1